MSWENTLKVSSDLKKYSKHKLRIGYPKRRYVGVSFVKAKGFYRDDPETFIARIVANAKWDKEERENPPYELLQSLKMQYRDIKNLHEIFLTDLDGVGLL